MNFHHRNRATTAADQLDPFAGLNVREVEFMRSLSLGEVAEVIATLRSIHALPVAKRCPRIEWC